MEEDRPPSLRARTTAGFGWTFAGTGFQGALRILVLAVLARLITPEEFGLVGAALVVVGISKIVSQLGVGPAVVQHPELSRGHQRAAFWLSLLMGLVLFLLVFYSAGLVARFFRMEGLTPVVQAMAPVFLLQALSMVPESMLQRELEYRRIAVIYAGSYLLGFAVVGVGMALAGLGVWALVGANLGQAGVKAGWLLLARPVPVRPSFRRSEAGELLVFGMGMTTGKLFNYLATQGDNMVIGRALGADALGIYGRAYQFLVMPATLFGSVMNRVLFPAMAQVQGDARRLARAYRSGISALAFLVLPTSVVLILSAREFVLVFLGPDWLEVVLPFRILAVGMLFRTSYKISDSLAKASGSVYRRAWRQALYAAAVVAGAVVGARYGVAGVAAGVLGAIALNFLLMAHLSLAVTRMSWGEFLLAHREGVLLAAVVGPATWLTLALTRPALSGLPLLVLAAAGGVAGAVALVLVRLLPSWFLGPDLARVLRQILAALPARGRRLLEGLLGLEGGTP